MNLSKWAIRRTSKNAKELNEYFGKLYNRKYVCEKDYFDQVYFFHYPMVKSKVVFDHVVESYTLITYEEFINNYKWEAMKVKYTEMQVGKIYYCVSSRSSFAQLIRYLGFGKIDTNVDITDINKPIKRFDGIITNHKKWSIREATDTEISIFKLAIGEETIVHYYNLI